MADPWHADTEVIDILIGAATFAEIIEDGLIKGEVNEPMVQKTKLGWILSGAYSEPSALNLFNISNENLDLTQQLRKFWEIEEVKSTKHTSPEEKYCEELFMKTTYQHTDGKLVVRLPFNEDPTTSDFLGKSECQALVRFNQIERKLKRDPMLKIEYTKCLNEYLSLGHATRSIATDQQNYMLPHHAVIKTSSATTKVRVVFDASCKSANGFSLNDRLHTGPTIQSDIWSVLMRFLCKRVAIIADIEKMYRQIWVHKDDRKFQQIFWRSSESARIERYQLNTVTFGTASAPYLAIRSLHYIADNIAPEQPHIANIIKENFYVDDLMATAEDQAEAKQLKEALIKAFAQYGFNLRQWNSNFSEILDNDTIGQT